MSDFELAAIAAILIGIVLSIAIPEAIGSWVWSEIELTPEFYLNLENVDEN